jgi:hypothetical protein
MKGRAKLGFGLGLKTKNRKGEGILSLILKKIIQPIVSSKELFQTSIYLFIHLYTVY